MTDLVTLVAGNMEALVAPSAGMLVGSLRHRGDELFARRADAGYVHAQRPVDGLAAPVSIGEPTQQASVRAGDTPVAFGWHPFLTLRGEPRPQWIVELGSTQRLELDKRKLPTRVVSPWRLPPTPLGEQEFDHAITGISGPLALIGERRRITVEFEEGARHTASSSPHRRAPRVVRADGRAHERAGHRFGASRSALADALHHRRGRCLSSRNAGADHHPGGAPARCECPTWRRLLRTPASSWCARLRWVSVAPIARSPPVDSAWRRPATRTSCSGTSFSGRSSRTAAVSALATS